MIRHLFALSMFVIVAGCDTSEFDMGDQPKAKPQTSESFFADGASARPLVAGVVARDGVRNDTAAAIPIPVTRALLERGQSQYNISCSVCHGQLGTGDGMIAERGLSQPPSFHVQRLKDAPDAHFYNVITHGYGAMFSYNDRVAEPDRWAIVAYIRALQAASDSPSLSDADRAALIAGGDTNAPKGGGR